MVHCTSGTPQSGWHLFVDDGQHTPKAGHQTAEVRADKDTYLAKVAGLMEDRPPSSLLWREELAGGFRPVDGMDGQAVLGVGDCRTSALQLLHGTPNEWRRW